MTSLSISGQTDVGQRRKDNQDTFVCSTIWSASSALLAVIDGVGGYAGGDRAAAIAKESIERYMVTPTGDPLSMLREAVVFANNQINEQRQQDRRLGQMCCVLTTAVADVELGKLYFVHVGDTRLYRYRQGTLDKLTYDHSLVGVREDANELTEAEAMSHPRRNEILREVGSTVHRVDDPDFLESGETDFLPGDQLLLCSDGLTDMITQAQIVAILNQQQPLEKQLEDLIHLANEQGGNDNITVVLAKNNTSATNRPVPAASAKLDPAPTTNQPLTSTEPLAYGDFSDKPQARKSNLGALWFALGFILAGVIAAVVWYQYPPFEQADIATDSLDKAGNQSDSTRLAAPGASQLDSLLQTAYRSKDHQLLLADDTIRLSQPLVLSDSLQTILGNGKLTVLMPVDTAQTQPAVRISRHGSANLENIVIHNFKTGIETTSDATLRLSNVYFKRVGQPILTAIRQDTFRNSVVAVSIQNPPAPSQPTRR
ncbi:SpoIIE family protein phosphatase [Spirosoma agri]|uniref:SpoIIE family protein phosphatase n=1 Tax=Spirosoma agri TaxID=1987381 RepID=A0A6M0IRY2_9BACT|nr:protein phosphatase 2C domain-containing protein [Spirosoma agri]NEU70141.1 SpoIIE family protein phosphatase [Spirosoma agri]